MNRDPQSVGDRFGEVRIALPSSHTHGRMATHLSERPHELVDGSHELVDNVTMPSLSYIKALPQFPVSAKGRRGTEMLQ